MKYSSLVIVIVLSVVAFVGCTDSKLSKCLKENEQLRKDIQAADKKILEYRETDNRNTDLLGAISDELQKCNTSTEELERENEVLKISRKEGLEMKKGVEELKAIQQHASQQQKQHSAPDANSK